MTNFDGENVVRRPNQAQIIEEMQARHAQILEDSGIARKAIWHMVERAGSRNIENMLLEGMPLVMESRAKTASILFVGIRCPIGESTTTKLLPLAIKMPAESTYSLYGISRFDDDDCRLAAELCEEARLVHATIAPDYSLELGAVSE